GSETPALRVDSRVNAARRRNEVAENRRGSPLLAQHERHVTEGRVREGAVRRLTYIRSEVVSGRPELRDRGRRPGGGIEPPVVNDAAEVGPRMSAAEVLLHSPGETQRNIRGLNVALIVAGAAVRHVRAEFDLVRAVVQS